MRRAIFLMCIAVACAGEAAAARLDFSTFFGGSSLDTLRGVAVDAQGAIYVAGATQSPDLPVTIGKIPARHTLPLDAYVAKFDPSGSQLIWSTRIGGGSTDEAFAVAVDPSGSVIMAGRTESLDFPATPGSAQRFPVDANNGVGDGFVARLNADTGDLVAATFLGGNGRDSVLAVAADGAVLVGGETSAEDFPVRRSFRNSACGGQSTDGWVGRLSSDLTQIQWAGYLCGRADDRVRAIALTPSGQVVVAGDTEPIEFPVSPGSLKEAGPDRDAFAARIRADGSALEFVTLLGGAETDAASGVAVASDGRIFVTGETYSPQFGTSRTTGRAASALEADAFIAVLNSSNGLGPVVRIGGGRTDRATGIAVAGDTIYIAGITASPDFPVTPARCQTGGGAGNNGFVVALGLNLSAIRFSFLLPGAADDGARSVAAAGGRAVVAGETESVNFATTAIAYRSAYAEGFRGVRDGFLAAVSTAAEPSAPCIALNGLLHGATFLPGPVAPGEILTIFGAGLGPAAGQGLELLGGVLTKELAGTRVLFDGVPAAMLLASEGQVNLIAPYSLAGRTTTSIVIERDGVRTAPIQLPIAPARPGIFSLNSSGQGPGAILNQDGTLNTPANPAQPGSVVSIFATGAGALTSGVPDGSLTPLTPPFPAPVLPVRVEIGGVVSDVLYAGGAPGLVSGLLQVNARIPLSLKSSSAMPIVIIVGDSRSPSELYLSVR